MDLRLVSLFKSLRGETKDHEDVQLIQNLHNVATIYGAPKSQGKAIKRRRQLLVRAFVDSILGHFPEAFSSAFRAFYRFFRSIFRRIFRLKQNYL